MTTTSLLIDCDPGLDDAVALLLAFAARDVLDLKAITTVAGNVPVEMTARNARMIREIAGAQDIPVHAGCAAPLQREPVFATEFHGESGLAGIDPFEPRAPLSETPAIDAMAELLSRAPPGSVRLVATGPLTNLARLLGRQDLNRAAIGELAIMGGASAAGGNITAHAEFNIFADPHAAERVFRAGGPDLPITVFSLDFTHQVRCSPARVDALRSAGNAAGEAAARLLEASNRFEQRENGRPDAPLHDPCPVAYLIAPDLFDFQAGTVTVDTAPGARFGQTRFVPGNGPVRWARYRSGLADAIFDLLTKRIASL